MNVVHAVDDVWMPDELMEERDRGLDPVDDELRKRPLEPHHALIACLAVHDELADQAVVVGRDSLALIGAAVDADTQPSWRMPIGNLAGRRPECARVLGIDTAFDGVAGENDVLLLER
jgi:hypothetical protein